MSYIDKECMDCSKIFEAEEKEIKRGWGKFCSRTCSLRYINKNRLRNKIIYNTECFTCSNKLYRKPFLLKKNNKFFCNRVCQSDFRRIDRRNRYSFAKIRNRLREERGNKCQICGWNICAIDIHHIESVKLGGSDEDDNLVLLCPNHHRMADRGIVEKTELKQVLMGSTGID